MSEKTKKAKELKGRPRKGLKMESEVSLYLIFCTEDDEQGTYIVANSMMRAIEKWQNVNATAEEPMKIQLVAVEVLL